MVAAVRGYTLGAAPRVRLADKEVFLVPRVSQDALCCLDSGVPFQLWWMSMRTKIADIAFFACGNTGVTSL